MADNIAEIRKLFADRGVSLAAPDVWAVQGIPVVKHKALERLAAAIKIRWQKPEILRAERDEAVILVTGAIGEHIEWSIGEALIVPTQGTGGNYKVSGKQASYIWAMAEKRGKDRVIIKLAGIDAYSEEESDDFQSRHQEGGRDPNPQPVPAKVTSGPGSAFNALGEAGALMANTKIIIYNATDTDELIKTYKADATKRERLLSVDQRQELHTLIVEKVKQLRALEAAE